MRIQYATIDDIPGWLKLAAEVEFLFGPMIDDPGFHEFLHRNIGRSTAICVREQDGPPGSALMGGLVFSAKPPLYRISWLSVARQWRQHSVGRTLIEHVFALVQAPAEMLVITFGDDVAAGLPARRFYQAFGFLPAEAAPVGPEGGSRQIFRRAFSRLG